MIIDLHCDTLSLLYKNGVGLRRNDLSVDLEKLRRGGAMAQFFAMYVDLKTTDDPLQYALSLTDLFHREMEANAGDAALATNICSLAANRQSGKLSAFLTIEEGGVLKGELANLRIFYRLGVRLLTLTWNYPNEIGYPNVDPAYRDRGLTEFGREVVAEMNRLGMIVDVSHLSDRGFYDVAAASAAPFVASHSNCRAVTGHPRNLTDDMIRRLAEKGGVAGLNFSGRFLGTSPTGRMADMVRHVRHLYQVGGIDSIALGSDFDGIASPVEFVDFSGYERLLDALRRDGFSEDEVEKMSFANAARVIKDCL